MQVYLNSVDRTISPVPLLITLTYHNEWSEDPAIWKEQLKAFRKRLERKYGRLSAIWRLEYQRRGAPHFHLMCFFWHQGDRQALLSDLRDTVGVMWWQVTGETSEDHLRYGTRCEEPRSWKGANVYLSKYMTKLEQLDLGAKLPGRFWGVWRKDDIPVLYETYSITRDQGYQVRRIMRRYVGRRAFRNDGGSFSCFLSYSTSLRLLRWLDSPAFRPPRGRSPASERTPDDLEEGEHRRRGPERASARGVADPSQHRRR